MPLFNSLSLQSSRSSAHSQPDIPSQIPSYQGDDSSSSISDDDATLYSSDDDGDDMMYLVYPDGRTKTVLSSSSVAY